MEMLKRSASMKAKVSLAIRALPHDVAGLLGERLAQGVRVSSKGEPEAGDASIVKKGAGSAQSK
jgi:hypothetical protein